MRSLIILTFGFLLFFMSCNGVKTRLDETDLGWMSYDAGDTLVFRSEKGDLDTTFILQRDLKYYPYNPIEKDGKYHPQVGQIWMQSSVYPSRKIEMVYLNKSNPDEPAEGFVRFVGDTFFTKHDNFDLLESGLIVHGQKYEAVYSVTSNYVISKGCRNIKQLFWAADVGVVRYVTCDGAVWDIVE